MNTTDLSLLLTRARRHQSAGRYDEAIATYRAAAGLAPGAPIGAWVARAAAGDEAVVPLVRAMRELQISRLAIDRYLGEIGRSADTHLGFSSLSREAFADLEQLPAIARSYLLASTAEGRAEDLDAMLDIAVDDGETAPALEAEILARPHLRHLHARVHIDMARRLLADSRFQEACDHLDRAIHLSPCHGLAHRLLGEALTQLGRAAAAAHCFDRAAAFWNPTWWSIDFPPGTRMRVPGIIARGHDIYYWDNTFVAIKISARRRRLKALAVRLLRRLHGMYQRHGRGWLQMFSPGTALAPVWRLPGATRLARRGRRLAFRIRTRLRPVEYRLRYWIRRGGKAMRATLGRPRRFLGFLFRRFSRFEDQGVARRRGWREFLATRVAQAEIMWGAESTLRAKSLQEMLELLESTPS